MTIWIDAQLSPALALWINENFEGITARSVRALGLRDATDREIFMQAKEARAIVMSKDKDFVKLFEVDDSPPSLIWITCGNTSNANMRTLLDKHLFVALQLIEKGEKLVEISDMP